MRTDGVPTFKKPEPRNASITLVIMAVILGTSFFGLSVLAQHLEPLKDEEGLIRDTVLAQLADAEPDGEESLQGTPALRYRGWLPAAGDGSGLGLTDDEQAMLQAQPGARVQVTIWIDPAGRIVQVMRTLQDAGPVAATSIVRLTDFGIYILMFPQYERVDRGVF